ncbi:transcriptional corepressor SEUSS-like [Abeliophyllum distichum]|uniref:Transcriptional corepressor SEUSS-like n=1 Tax=Abeliophyllum distichum TaxID=126358 RepID=A0ABD1QJ22_9LAMI
MMMSSQLGGGSMVDMETMVNDVKNINGLSSSSNNSELSGRNGVVGNRVVNGNPSIGGSGFETMGNGLGQSIMVNGIRATPRNNSMNMNRRGSMNNGGSSTWRDPASDRAEILRKNDVGLGTDPLDFIKFFFPSSCGNGCLCVYVYMYISFIWLKKEERVTWGVREREREK